VSKEAGKDPVSFTYFESKNFPMSSLIDRFIENPLIKPSDVLPSRKGFIVECVMNPGVFRFDGKIWLVTRVAERPKQIKGSVSTPILSNDGEIKVIEFPENHPDLDISDSRHIYYKNEHYLSTLSHLRLFCSYDGINFYEPKEYNTIISGRGYLENFGIEDCRVAQIGDEYLLTFTSVSSRGVGVSLIRTKDWVDLRREGLIFLPHNKDCALFEETINGKYYCFNRPSGLSPGGNFIWISSSPDLIHWGNHHCILETREGYWDSDRVGAGGAPIRTKKGWLAIYHGSNGKSYSLGAVLLDLDDPTKVLKRSEEPIMYPTEPYEKAGFFGNVVFTNGHYVNGDEIVMYYGASDTSICAARLSIKEIQKSLEIIPKHISAV
jgi:predicted GH43/DUF377 family glycosyl hydrolase